MKLIQMANGVSTAIASGSPINLGVIDRKATCGECDPFNTTDTSIAINKPGYYLVSVDVNIIANIAGNVAIQLYDGSTPIVTASASNVALANSIYNLSFSKIVRVLPNCNAVQTNAPKVLSVYNVGVAGTIASSNISIIKIN